MPTLNPAEMIERARSVAEKDARAVAALAGQFDERLLHVVQLLLECRGHVLVTGAGTSRAVAMRFAHLLSCCGVPALYIDAADGLHGGSGAVRPEDVLFVISKDGHSAEINEFAQITRDRGSKIVVQTENPESPLAALADAVFEIKTTGDVDPHGVIALGTSLVGSAAGNVLCALLLELNGYTREQFVLTHPGGAVGKLLPKAAGRA